MNDVDMTDTQPAKKKRNSCLGCFTGLVIALGLGFILVVFMGNYLIASDPLKHVDAIVVLSGSESDRIPEAALLYKEGYSSTVILTDTGLSKTPTPGTEEIPIDPNGIKAGDLAQMGVPKTDIILPEHVVSSTAGEAQAVLDTMQRMNLKSAMIVTDPYHTRRAKLIFDSVFQGSGIRLRIHPVAGHWYRPFTWLLHPTGWKYMILEYGKLLYTFLGR